MTDPVARVERLLPAPCDVVYDEWLSPLALSDWMCPRPARLRGIELDPVVGGRFRFDIVEEGREILVAGHYLTLERPHMIRFTWSCSTWPQPLVESIVTVELRPSRSDETHMTIRHELVPPETVDSHAAGWRVVADQLADRLAARSLPAGEHST
jgi:uncharacterized protein YndB with AHSA1/START domain